MAGLADYEAGAVLRAEDYDRAAKFYTEVLGLSPGETYEHMREGRFMAGSGTGIGIYERPGMPAPQNTTLGFQVPVDKLEDVVADLRNKGVVFEEYDNPEIGLKTVNGIAEVEGRKAAWFKDSEGNILVLGV